MIIFCENYEEHVNKGKGEREKSKSADINMTSIRPERAMTISHSIIIIMKLARKN